MDDSTVYGLVRDHLENLRLCWNGVDIIKQRTKLKEVNFLCAIWNAVGPYYVQEMDVG